MGNRVLFPWKEAGLTDGVGSWPLGDPLRLLGQQVQAGSGAGGAGLYKQAECRGGDSVGARGCRE